MEKIVGDYLSSIELGDMQQYKNMAVFPLFTSLNHGPEYLTLKEALALGVLAITEISQRGILVFINGKATGLDMVSRESACAILNPKLVKSYAIDAHLEMRGKEKDYEISPDKALRFLKKASGCKEERYESIGVMEWITVSRERPLWAQPSCIVRQSFIPHSSEQQKVRGQREWQATREGEGTGFND